MDLSKHLGKVERTLNYLLVIAVLMLVGVLAKNFLFARIDPAVESSQIYTGSVFPGLEDTQFSDADQWIIFAINPDCRFSRDSTDFYQRAHSVFRDDTRVQFLALFDSSSVKIEEFMVAEGLQGIPYRTVDFRTITSVTPTTWVINRLGIVELALEGRLSEDQENELILKVQHSSVLMNDR